MKKSELRKLIREEIQNLIEFQSDWGYFYLKHGVIVDKRGKKAFVDKDNKNFKSIEAAEKWLEKKDYRGTIVGNL